MSAYVPKIFSRAFVEGAFDPHGLREKARELEWRAGDADFVGPVACPLWFWLRLGCPCDIPESARRAIRAALAKRADSF